LQPSTVHFLLNRRTGRMSKDWAPHSNLLLSSRHCGYEYYREMCRYFCHDVETPHVSALIPQPRHQETRLSLQQTISPNMAPVREIEELQKYTHDGPPRRIGGERSRSYPKSLDVERIVIPESNELFSPPKPTRTPSNAVARLDATLSCQAMPDQMNRQSEKHPVSSSPVHPSRRKYPSVEWEKREVHIPSDDRIELELSPNFYLPLHGSEETRRAVRDGLIKSCACLSCKYQMHCISMASCVVCPRCREISPIVSGNWSSCSGGIGLGVTELDLLTWQE
jgi:hypothetical protein